MRRCCSPALAVDAPVFVARASAFVVAFVVVTGVGCSGVEIALTLEPGPDSATGGLTDTSTIKTLQVKMTSTGESEVQEFPASAVAQTPISLQHVDNKNPVTIDVRGCETANICDDVKFRGCSPPTDFSQDAGKTHKIEIKLLHVDDPLAPDCGPL